MTADVVMPMTIGDELARQGWHAVPGAQVRWQRETPAGPATLTRGRGSSAWEEWDLRGGAVPASDPLVANAAVDGPGKLLHHPGGGCAWRFDLPRGLLAPPDGFGPEAGEPLAAWVRGVGAVAAGGPVAGETFDPADVAARLEKDGWPAVAVDGEVRVRVSLPGLYRQVAIDGSRVRCELVELDGAGVECQAAALHLATAANDRLRLARFALSPDDPAARVVAEVHLGLLGVSGPWPGVALEALHAAVVLTARELAALRGDRELARAYLAAQAARKEGVGCPPC
jgi:hypothetical protein